VVVVVVGAGVVVVLVVVVTASKVAVTCTSPGGITKLIQFPTIVGETTPT
jgi:hypothetical protein